MGKANHSTNAKGPTMYSILIKKPVHTLSRADQLQSHTTLHRKMLKVTQEWVFQWEENTFGDRPNEQGQHYFLVPRNGSCSVSMTGYNMKLL